MAPRLSAGLCAIVAVGACGRTPPTTGHWGVRELAVVVEHPPQEHGGHQRIALVRPDTEEFAWTPLYEARSGAWLYEGSLLFASTGDHGSAWRYGDASAFVVPPSEGAYLYKYAVSPQGRSLLQIEGLLDASGANVRVLDGRSIAELGRWTGCPHREPWVWIDEGPGLLMAEADCDAPAGEGPFRLMRVAQGATQMLVELEQQPIVAHPSPDGRWLAAAYDEHGLIIDLRTGAVAFEEGAPGLPRLVWNRDSTLFAYRGDTESIVRDVTMAEVARFRTTGGQPQFSFVDERVASVDDQTVVVFDPTTRELQSFDAPVPVGRAMWFDGDHRIHLEPDSDHPRRMAYVLDPDTGSWVELLSLGRFRFEPYWSPDGSSLLAFEACDEETQRPVLFDDDLWRRAEGPCRDYWGVVWSPDSDVAALQVAEGQEVLLLRDDGETRSLGQGDIVGWRP